MRLRNSDHAIRITAENVAGSDTRITDIHRAVDRFQLHTVFAGAHRITPAEHRIADFPCEMGVAAGAVDDGTGDLAAMSNHGKDVAPDRSVFAATVVDDDDAAFRDFIDEIANRSRGNAGRTVQQRVGAPRETESRIERLDIKTPPRNAKPIQS